MSLSSLGAIPSVIESDYIFNSKENRRFLNGFCLYIYNQKKYFNEEFIQKKLIKRFPAFEVFTLESPPYTSKGLFLGTHKVNKTKMLKLKEVFEFAMKDNYPSGGLSREEYIRQSVKELA